MKDTAKKTGKGRSTVQRDVTRAKKVKNLDQAIGTSLDKGDEIDALSKLSEKEQDRLIKQAKSGKKVSAKTEAKKVRRAEREKELGKKQKALPDTKFGVIVADPEWDDEVWSRATGKTSEKQQPRPLARPGVVMHTGTIGFLIDTPDGPQEQFYWWASEKPEQMREIDAYGPFDTKAEAEEDARIVIAGPDCEVIEGGRWDPAWEKPQ